VAEIDRRTALAVICAGAGALVVAGCSGGSSATGAGSSAGGAPTAAASPGARKAKAAAKHSAGGAALAKVAAIPVGGSAVVQAPSGAPVALFRSHGTDVVAHSAVCTHAGCTVQAAGKQLACPCHGSVFDAATGAVVNGPASTPLSAVAVKVAGGEVLEG
jgi:Rieske Fe-S protein